MRWLEILVLAAVLALVLSGCGGGDDSEVDNGRFEPAIPCYSAGRQGEPLPLACR